jgi:ankyrin repeat protein
MAVSRIINNNKNSFIDLSTNLKQYTSRVKKAVEYALWIRDTYSISNYKQPLIAQPLNASQIEPVSPPFDGTDLVVYPDDYVGPMPIQGIRQAEYREITKIYEDVIQGKSTIAFATNLPQDLRRLLEMDFILLLTRPTSRKLLLAIYNNKIPLTMEKGDCFFQDSGKVSVDTFEIRSLISRELNDRENQFLTPSPHFILLAHEFSHVLFDHLYGDRTAYGLFRTLPTLNTDFNNLLEQLIIKGDKDGKFENFEINEQQMCREFGIPYREDHHMGGPFLPDANMTQLISDEESDAYSWYADGDFREGQFPIRYATLHGATLNVVHWLRNGGNANLQFKGGRTLLHEAIRGGNDKIATFLIEQGADVHAVDDKGRSLVHECAYRDFYSKTDDDFYEKINCSVYSENRTKTGKTLINNGAPIDLKDSSGLTPIQLAYKYNPSLASLLFDSGANVQAIDLSSAIEKSDFRFVQRLLDSGVSIDPIRANSLFKNAVGRRQYDMARVLLKIGMDINFQEIDPLTGKPKSGTVLFDLMPSTDPEKIKFLLDNGADPSCQNENGYTAFHYAYSNRDLEALSLLHQKDPQGHLIKSWHTALWRTGKSVADLAKEDRWEEALKVLGKNQTSFVY